jgi:pyruvyltransferase
MLGYIRRVARLVHAFWCRIPSRGNVGDALTPWLVRRLTGRLPRFARPGDPFPKYLVAGSVLGYADERSTVWGAGIISQRDRVNPDATLLAVRGPLSRERALACGAACPEVYGDPGLLLSRLYPVPDAERQGIGLVPHFSDAPAVVACARLPPDVKLIDVQASVEHFAERIASCDVVASSSLHGLIVAHAYGVPAVWIKFKDLPSGDDSKFRDHFLSLGMEPPEPVRLAVDDINFARLADRAVRAELRVDVDELWRRCPFL